MSVIEKITERMCSDARLSPKGLRADEFRMFLNSALADYRKESDNLRSALHRYGDHNTDCPGRLATYERCDCGFAEALEL